MSWEELSCYPPPSRFGIPWLVYPDQGSESTQQKFYSIVDGQIMEERYDANYNNTDCLSAAHGWLLLQSCKTYKKVFLYNPFSFRRHPLPKLKYEKPDMFLPTFSTKSNWVIVAIYKENHPYFLYTSPGNKAWKKIELNMDNDYDIVAASSYGGKVYLLKSERLLIVIQFESHPIIKYLDTKFQSDALLSNRCSSITELVASMGDIFLVQIVLYENIDVNLIRTLMVYKLDLISMAWVPTETLNDCVFVIGTENSSSFCAANTKLKGNCIYYVSSNVLYCFNMKYKSLTASYPFSDATYNACYPFLLLPAEDTEMNHEPERQDHIKEKTLSLTYSYDKFIFDHPRFLSPPSSSRRAHNIHISKFRTKCFPKTPCLMFTHKDDGTYKVIDPCTKTVYELIVPELASSMIFASIDGWLFAQDRFSDFIFINPLSKQKIYVLTSFNDAPFSVGFSAPPTEADCKVFLISQLDDVWSVQISIYQPYDYRKSTTKFEHTAEFQLSHSNAMYLEGCFYCLGMNGNLGVYDPNKDSWRVLNTSIDIENEVHNCAIVESGDKLLSVFLDSFQRPLGMFEFDLDICRWKRITNIADRTYFFGQGASFCVTATDESMRNKIYFPTFNKECSLDLVTYPLWLIDSVPNSSTDAKTGYIHIWVELKMF